MVEALQRVIRSGQFILGEEVLSFEKEFAGFIGTDHAVGVASGLDALHIALRSLDIGKGDEVIVPGNTYFASVLAVLQSGATPVLVDPDEVSHLLHPSAVEKAITPRTRAVMPVHLYGIPCQMDGILDVAHRYGLRVVEDNAQAQGATFRGRRTGSFGDINATSFYPTKNLGAFGDGGAITTDDPELEYKARLWRNYGSPERGIFEVAGLNSRLDELQAAFLRSKLQQLDQQNATRCTIAARYTEAFTDLGDLTLPVPPQGSMPIHHVFVLRTASRNALQAHLEKHGIGTLVHYPVPPHLQPAFMNSLGGSAGTPHLPVSEKLARTILSIPIYPSLTDDEQDHLIRTVRSFWHTNA
jgi:dTDP-4-amino-4,6-dideoxygalactose transaminase